jgi:polysaccharide export outer membrane protein
MMRSKTTWAALPLVVLAAAGLWGQSAPPAGSVNSSSSSYTLGPDDQIMVRALHVPEIPDKPIHIAADGSIQLPMVGRMQAGGLTTWRLETELKKALREYVQEPEVSVELVEQRSQPVTVLGAVKTPGSYQLRGPRTLIEVLSLAGGVDADAGYLVRVARRASQGPLPVANAKPDSTGGYSVAEINLQEAMDGKFAESSIAIRPYDVVTVPRAKMIYVIGEVKKQGGFVLRETQHISVLQALAMAEGMTKTAGGKNAKVLRPTGDGDQRREVPVNVPGILAGKTADAPLEPGDILFIPNSAAKSATFRSIEAAIQMATGLVIWRP